LTKLDAIFTNSTNTKNRLKHFTGYDAEIIYPPVDLSRFVPFDDVIAPHAELVSASPEDSRDPEINSG